MESSLPKNIKKRKNKRRWKKKKNKHLDREKVEVISKKRQILIADTHSYECKSKRQRQEIVIDTMAANSFWENYDAAKKWQDRHNVIWWKTRCTALEHENNILKEELRALLQNNPGKSRVENTHLYNTNSNEYQYQQNETEEEIEEEIEETQDDDLEFQVGDEMIKFLEKSMRHKMELKQKREDEKNSSKKEEKKVEELEGGADWVKKRIAEGQLLYGEGSSRILAMETAIQATNDRYLDKIKPQYWPNIGLNL